mmetsp:Transcript_14600/g.24233  ORF Transcript_14600/g.24233 Transcript_14600/m.24233 type:complete len:160 (-) Transcript_14600:2185-2664(-)
MATPLTVSNEREVTVADLTLDQLSGLKTQHEDELTELQHQLEQLHGARNRYNNSMSTLDNMGRARDEQTMLIPLNSSLYAPGKVSSPNKVIVELGTGYFCEKTIPEAKKLIERKVALVNKSMESIENVGTNKKKNLDQITMVMQYKMQQAREQQEHAKK